MARRLIARFSPLSRLGAAPCARSSHGVSVHNNLLYVIGGEATARTPIDSSVHVLPLLEQSAGWRTIPPAEALSPPPRIAHAQAVVAGEKLLLFGGREGVQMEEAALNDLWSFDLAAEAWAPVEFRAGDEPCPRSFHAATAIGEKLYIYGGCGSDGRLSDLYEYCTVANAWRRLPDAPVRGRGGAVLEASSDGGALWLLGGFAGEETRDLLRFDLGTEEWRKHPSEWLRPRSVCASFGLGGSIFAFGGEVEPSNKGHEGAGGFADDLVAVDEATGEPLAVTIVSDAPDGSLPRARGWGGAAVASGSTAAFFGGLSGSDVDPVRLDDGWLVKVETG